MSSYSDTYFLSYEVAYETAKQQNMLNEFDMQVCYYDGVEQKHNLKNLINIPFEKMRTEFLTINERTPTQINIEGLNFSIDVQNDIILAFKQLIDTINQDKETLSYQLLDEIKKQEINFDEPLRILITSNKKTKVMQNISANITDSFLSKGFEIRHEIDNELENITLYRLFKVLKTVKPHIYISINHSYRKYINDTTFNFVWYQDATPELKNNLLDPLHKRDIVFSLVQIIDKLLATNKIKYQRQSFCINRTLFNTNSDIKRENKIIFIGSSYSKTLEKANITNIQFEHIKNLFYQGFDFNEKANNKLALDFGYEQSYFDFYIINPIIRLLSVLELCKLDNSIKVEIYGYEWEDIKEVQPYFKGVLEYSELPNVYRSAKYVLAPHSHYIMQQRVLEAAACGAIPIVYDCRSIDNPPYYLDSVLLYKNPTQIKTLTTKEVPQLNTIVSENSYDTLTDKIITIVKNKINQ